MLVIFDKDGTLVKPASGREFVQDPEDQVLLPGVAKRIQELKEMGARIVIASNQGGVEAGHKSLESAIAEMKYLLGLLPQVKEIYFCPDLDGRECWCVSRSFEIVTKQVAGKHENKYYPSNSDKPKHNYRKPNPGMLNYARIIHSSPEEEAWMIGDRPEDHQAAIAAEIGFLDAEAWREGRAIITPSAVIV